MFSTRIQPSLFLYIVNSMFSQSGDRRCQEKMYGLFSFLYKSRAFLHIHFSWDVTRYQPLQSLCMEWMSPRRLTLMIEHMISGAGLSTQIGEVDKSQLLCTTLCPNQRLTVTSLCISHFIFFPFCMHKSNGIFSPHLNPLNPDLYKAKWQPTLSYLNKFCKISLPVYHY